MGFGQRGHCTGFTRRALRIVGAWWLRRQDRRSVTVLALAVLWGVRVVTHEDMDLGAGVCVLVRDQASSEARARLHM